ncbi:MAG TPA: glycosyltransferase family 4 protein [Solirubrobacteraceae bacterium]|nr:glycosyltransferase family 4 protein [Solirubrobacteraceae bacterium]
MVLFLHHRYRNSGGEERAAEGLARIVRARLGEEVVMLERDSGHIGSGAAAAGLLGGGLRPDQVAEAVRRLGARIVHAHNLQPTFGWRALAAARAAGARTVLHLHNYRLVCAIGVCFRDGRDCTDCHARNTLPGLLHDCRGARGEALAYAAGLAAWQRATLDHADVVAVPSEFARRRLVELGLPVSNAIVVPNPVGEAPPPDAGREAPPPDAAREAPPSSGAASEQGRNGALVVSRLAPEKGIDVAVDACALAGIPLTVAGEGPERVALEARARALGATATFLGRVPAAELSRLRSRAAVAVVPSRSAETFGLAAAEAMDAGLPVAASRVGALPELVPGDWLAPPGDASALSTVIARLAADRDAGARGRELVRRHAGPAAVARALQTAYDAATA